jgi:glycerate kinase
MALGARLWDRHDFPVAPEPREMVRLARADLSAMDGRLDGVTTVLASDVDNPLLGRHGASAVYGPQKGATPEMLPLLDKAVGKWRDALARERPGAMDLAAAPGAGAAGGLGFALMLLAGAQMRPGIELVIELTGLRQRVASADLVMTGEGRLDGQSLRGKAPAGIAALALEHGIPCVAIAGQVAVGRRELGAAGLSAAYALTELAPSADVAIQRAGHYAAETAGRVAREWSRA